MTALPEDLARLLDDERGWPVSMTEAEYLEFERRSRLKHEFVEGLVWLWSGYDDLDTQTGLAGASDAHNLTRGNVYAGAPTWAWTQSTKAFPPNGGHQPGECDPVSVPVRAAAAPPPVGSLQRTEAQQAQQTPDHRAR
jgi:hypothetical protein